MLRFSFEKKFFIRYTESSSSLINLRAANKTPGGALRLIKLQFYMH